MWNKLESEVANMTFSLTIAGAVISQLIWLLNIEAPFFLAGDGIEGVNVGIAAPGVHNAERYGGRRLKSDVIVDEWVVAALESPLFLSGGGINRIEKGVPASEVHGAVR